MVGPFFISMGTFPGTLPLYLTFLPSLFVVYDLFVYQIAVIKNTLL